MYVYTHIHTKHMYGYIVWVGRGAKVHTFLTLSLDLDTWLASRCGCLFHTPLQRVSGVR